MRSNESGMDVSNERDGCLHPGKLICIQTYAANAATCAFGDIAKKLRKISDFLSRIKEISE